MFEFANCLAECNLSLREISVTRPAKSVRKQTQLKLLHHLRISQKEKSMKAFLSIFSAVVLFAIVSTTEAAPSRINPSQVIEGQIGKFLEPGMFWLTTKNGTRTLIYSDGESTKSFKSGQIVRVTGTQPLDWARLAESEISAQKIELVKL